jgi:putative endopeptidase
MTKFTARLLAGVVLCLAATGGALADPAAPAPSTDPVIRTGDWGFDAQGQDTSVRPGDDFFTYANGRFLSGLQIPADQSRYGLDVMLNDTAEARVRAILENPDPPSGAEAADAIKTRALYHAFMDQARIDALGAKPLEPDLAAVRAVKTREDLAVLQSRIGTFQGGLFGLDISADEKNPDRYAVYVSQGGLGLPEPDYYLKPEFAAKKARYQAYAAQMLRLAGWPEPDAMAKALVALETRIAEVSWSPVQERDPEAVYNPTTVAELTAAAPGYPWRAMLDAAELRGVDHIVVVEKTALPRIAAIYQETPLPVLKAWAAFHLVDDAAPFLTDRFEDPHFAFNGTVMTGQPEQRARWKRAVALDNGVMGEAVGRVYVARYFPSDSKAKIRALVENLRAALADRITRLDWMSPDTKARALAKLKAMTVKVGYPDKWRDYTKLEISGDDLYGDVERANAFEWRRKLARLNQPVDRSEWGMTPQTVNAYYNSSANEIVFPAAILQAPYFDPGFDAAANYGDIGATIGHEMTHGFDDEGRKFDGSGALANWWTDEDAKKFEARAAVLGKQFDSYEPFPGVHVNGSLTMGENIADLGGALIALDAYHKSLGGRPAPVIDGLTGDQRFFLSYAQSWREKSREDATREQIASDPHAPDQYRTNGVVRNMDAWYAAFDVKPGDKLYLAPEDRARIW